MPIAGEEFDQAARTGTVEAIQDRAGRGNADEKSRAPVPRRATRHRPNRSSEAEESYQLAGAAGLAASLAIATAFWSVVLMMLHVWVP